MECSHPNCNNAASASRVEAHGMVVYYCKDHFPAQVPLDPEGICMRCGETKRLLSGMICYGCFYAYGQSHDGGLTLDRNSPTFQQYVSNYHYVKDRVNRAAERRRRWMPVKAMIDDCLRYADYLINDILKIGFILMMLYAVVYILFVQK